MLAVAQMVRAAGCGPAGREFESRRSTQYLTGVFPMFIKLEDAIEIVMDLARENVIGEEYISKDLGMRAVREDQLEAIKVVEDHFTNNVWG